MEQKVKSTIPVYNIYALQREESHHEDVIVERFSSYLEVHPNLHAAHRHSFFHIVLFTEGGGKHTIDFEQFPVQAGQVYFMVPGQVHSWAFEGQTDGYVINFSAGIFNGFLKDLQFLEAFTFFRGIAADSVIRLSGDNLQQAISCFELMLREVAEPAGFSTEMICAQLLSLFITVSREPQALQQAAKPLHHHVVLQHFYKLVEQQYTEQKMPKDYARLLYITPNHLNALCRDLTGQSAGTIIRNRVLLEAKRLLVNAQLSIAEIAYQLNFKDNSYFTRFFKKYTGQTPEAFRKSSFQQ